MKIMAEFKAMVLKTAGTNCDFETAEALRLAGFSPETMHVNELIRGGKNMRDYRFLELPGGFSHGDYIASGKILANKLKYRLGEDVPRFIEEGNLVLGICNGFQTLVKAGLLPGFDGNYKRQDVTLTFNDSGHFQDEWIELKNVNKGRCVFSKGLRKTIHCPINHGEGKFIPGSRKVLARLHEQDQVVFKYAGRNPNGSLDDIAGICDETGRVLGLMPHCEKNLFSVNDPRSTRLDLPVEGEGTAIFRKAFEFVKKRK